MTSLTELLLTPTCAGCAQPGVHWCPSCHQHLQVPPRRIHVRLPSLTPIWSIAPYSGPVAAGIVELKEHRQRAVVPYFGEALADAAAHLVEAGDILDPRERPWLVIPAPSTADSVRERGWAHWELVAEAMAESIEREIGARSRVVVGPILQMRPHPDSVGMSVHQRRESISGSISVTLALQMWWWDQAIAGQMEILVVDDIVTTGATLGECFISLQRAGIRPRGALTLAAA